MTRKTLTARHRRLRVMNCAQFIYSVANIVQVSTPTTRNQGCYEILYTIYIVIKLCIIDVNYLHNCTINYKHLNSALIHFMNNYVIQLLQVKKIISICFSIVIPKGCFSSSIVKQNTRVCNISTVVLFCIRYR